MEVFVRVVEAGAFSAAARACGLTPSAVSKLVTRLESRLDTRLFNRSTRKLQLTPEGEAFHDRAVRILADIAEAERHAARGEHPAGRIRLNTSASFNTHVLAPLVPDFLAAYPDVTLDIVLTDLVVDLMDERADVAVRAGPLKSSGLIARRLGSSPMIIVGAPAYLEKHGTPQTISDLAGHTLLDFCYSRAQAGWPHDENGAALPGPRVQASDGEGLRQLALGGAGLARLAAFTVRADIAAGRLRLVLDGVLPELREDFYAVYIGQGGPLPTRVRVLLDFLAERVRLANGPGAA